MANKSKRVYQEYQNALERTKIQMKSIQSNGSATFIDINSYEDFIKSDFALEYNGIVYDGEIKYVYRIPDSNYAEGPRGPFYFDSGNPITGTYLCAGVYKYSDMNGTVFSVGGLSSITPEEEDGTFSALLKNICGANYSTEPTGKEFKKIFSNLINSGKVVIVEKNKESADSPIQTMKIILIM